MFKKILALLLAHLVVVSVPGFTLFVHYCNGSASSVSWIQEEDPCLADHNKNSEKACCTIKKEGIEKSERPCCTTSNIHSVQDNQHVYCSITHEDCCSTEVIKSVQTPLKAFRPLIELPKPLFYSCFFLLSFDLLINQTLDKELASTYYPPPNISCERNYVFNCTFLI